MRNIALIISYDGTQYCGFQRQNNGVTIQGAVEKALYELSGENLTVSGCGRTDAGVHAIEYLLTFKSNITVPVERIPLALNSLLPNDIRVKKSFECKDEFDGRFSVIKKTYMYLIDNREITTPFASRYSWHYKYKLDIDKMKKAAEYLIGEHDFVSFMAAGGQVKSTVRIIYSIKIEKNDDSMISISVEGNGFLYNMVRIIVGTLVYVGGGKFEPEYIKEILDSKERANAGITAPPQGLFMKNVDYGCNYEK